MLQVRRQLRSLPYTGARIGTPIESLAPRSRWCLRWSDAPRGLLGGRLCYR